MLIISSLGNKKFNKYFKVGDKIIKSFGYECEDILDYYYFDSCENIELEILRGDKTILVKLKKDFDESLDLGFESENLETKTCHNKCIFCFVDQMPQGMRKSLYLKDDDYRTSFLFGSFVTLTNCSDADIDRIIRLNLSPLYISVQATDEKTREKMLNNRFAGKINEYLKRLNDAGISMHTQVVLCPGINDGLIFEKTCFDLAKYENVLSVAVVPCGVTKFRQGLENIPDIDLDYARDTIQKIRLINQKIGKNLIMPADEFYLRAKMNVENQDFYNDYCQIENGVGIVRCFMDNYPQNPQKPSYRRTFLIVTGVSAYDIISNFAKKVMDTVNGVTVYVLPCKNKFFGESVTCAGLLVGGDILEAVQNFDKDFDELVLTDAMLKNDENVFLDGMTLDYLSKKINKPIRITSSYGLDFFDKLTMECDNNE